MQTNFPVLDHTVDTVYVEQQNPSYTYLLCQLLGQNGFSFWRTATGDERQVILAPKHNWLPFVNEHTVSGERHTNLVLFIAAVDYLVYITFGGRYYWLTVFIVDLADYLGCNDTCKIYKQPSEGH